MCCGPTALTDMLQVFEDWNKGELDSFLIEITKDILKFKDSDGEYSTLWCTASILCIVYLATCEGVKGDDVVKPH